jgi:predicted phage tail protein
MIPSMFAWFAWIIFSTIRRYKIAKLQAEVQTKLLEKVGSGQELLAYAQTEAGRELLESLKVERVSPHGRIIGALQTGIVLFFLGAALLLVRSHVSSGGEGFVVAGTLACALGVGFALSAASSYYLSKSFGLLNGAASHGPSHG